MDSCLPRFPDAPIRVISAGDTYEQARDNAYREAAETFVGAVVVSDKEAHNQKLVKNDILVYSAAYVDKFKLISQEERHGKVHIVIDVWLSPSKIANRILYAISNDTEFDGARMSEQYRTYIKTKTQGDRLVQKLLEPYPQNAFNIEKVSQEFKVNEVRVPYLHIIYNLKWNRGYLTALEEGINAVSDGKVAERNSVSRIMIEQKRGWTIIGSMRPYYFNDINTANLIYEKFQSKRIAVRLTLMNNNIPVYTTCNKVFPNRLYTIGSTDLDINGLDRDSFMGEFKISTPQRNTFDRVTNVVLSIDTEDRCAIR